MLSWAEHLPEPRRAAHLHPRLGWEHSLIDLDMFPLVARAGGPTVRQAQRHASLARVRLGSIRGTFRGLPAVPAQNPGAQRAIADFSYLDDDIHHGSLLDWALSCPRRAARQQGQGRGMDQALWQRRRARQRGGAAGLAVPLVPPPRRGGVWPQDADGLEVEHVQQAPAGSRREERGGCSEGARAVGAGCGPAVQAGPCEAAPRRCAARLAHGGRGRCDRTLARSDAGGGVW